MSSVFDFDLFRRPPPDLHERGTVRGSVLTLVGFIGVLFIATWHLVVFLGPPTKTTEIVVRQFRKDRVMVHVLLDIAMPCPLVDLEVHDVFGTHTLDAARNMRKHRVEASGAAVPEGREVLTGPDGNPIRVELEHALSDERRAPGKGVHPTYFENQGHPQLDSLGGDAVAAVGIMADSKEWCRFNGTVAVAKMPGKIFVRAHHAHLSKTYGVDGIELEWYNTSHVVHKLDFLDTDRFNHIGAVDHILSGLDTSMFSLQFSLMSMLQVFGLRATESPMSLTRKTMSAPRTNWRYDLQVVGHTLAKGDEIYDYTMGDYSYQLASDHQPREAAEPVSISYSFSPLTVMHKETHRSFFEFAQSLLSTLGGCFALLKVLDNSLYVGRLLLVKDRQGKLS